MALTFLVDCLLATAPFDRATEWRFLSPGHVIAGKKSWLTKTQVVNCVSVVSKPLRVAGAYEALPPTKAN
jgi:hypothetical protein